VKGADFGSNEGHCLQESLAPLQITHATEGKVEVMGVAMPA